MVWPPLLHVLLEKADWLAKCLLCMHAAIFDLQLSGVWEPALDNDHGDDLDENIYDTSEYQHRTGYYKQSRTLDPPPVPGWVKRNKSDLRWACVFS